MTFSLKTFSPRIRQVLSILLVLSCFQLSACGYLLYPERKGQTEGKLDSTVVVLDALGLLLYVVPGIVAFAVDISTGAIYLAPGEKSVIEKHADDLSLNGLVPLAPEDKAKKELARELMVPIASQFGQEINFTDVQIYTFYESRPISLVALPKGLDVMQVVELDKAFEELMAHTQITSARG